MLDRLRRANLKLRPSKCVLFNTQVKYLGHVVSEQGVSTDPDKCASVASWPTPSNLSEVRSFLGHVGYYRQFVPNFASIARPLTMLTHKGTPFEWGDAQSEAFARLRDALLTAPILGYPDHQLQYILDTDASAFGLGAVLSQIQDGKERVIGYFSKTMSPEERNYCVTRKELLAVVTAVKHFRPYLYDREFRIRTDHAALLWLC